MKRVAILIKGGISSASGSFRHKVARVHNANEHLDYHDYVNYTGCYNSIKKHILEANPNCSFDFYLHSWHPDLEENLNKLYLPIASIHEYNSKYTDIIKEKARYGGDENRWFNQASFALSIKRVTELLEKHKEKNYDLVMFYRYDVFLWKDMLMSQYTDDEIYANYFHKGDFHFIMTQEKALKFGMNLFDSISNTVQPKEHHLVNDFSREYFNKPLKGDNIIPGKYPGGFQEVIRKLKELDSKQLSEIPFEDYGLTRKEVDNYNAK
jgi:hypothetical protein